MQFQAFRVEKDGINQGHVASLTLDDLSSGDLVIKARYSSLNYKDALAVTGRGKILRRFPLNPGIDVAGIVHSSQHPSFREGDKVLVTGCGLGEAQDGGLSEYVRVPADWVIPLPDTLSLKESMIFGTAGFTAGLCLYRLLANGQSPDKGPIAVTGASGGVGSLAVAMLSKLGFEVLAISSKSTSHALLKRLGATEIIAPDALHLGSRPLESVRFGGAIDNVGGDLLSGILRHVNLWGNVASVGLAGGHEFSSSVMPFILRGVSLLGISSTNCPLLLRTEIWQNLAEKWRPKDLDIIVTREIALDALQEASEAMLQRQSQGRTLVSFMG